MHRHIGLFIGIGWVAALWNSSAGAQAVTDIANYLEYSSGFASAGQPTAAELELVRDAGFQRVIYIAFSTDRNAIPNEDQLVRELGMEYVQIPVVWNSPTESDYESFAAVMKRQPEARTLLHCQVNMRASAFAYLYRVIEQGVPEDVARADMNRIWQPNETWQRLIDDVLEAHGLATD